MSEGTSSLRVFTKESLIEHAKKNPSTTFISIHENVYDVTPFLDEVIKKNFLFQILKY